MVTRGTEQQQASQEKPLTGAAWDRHIYGRVDSVADLKNVFAAIRGDVEEADSQQALTELYRRAGYLVTLTYSPAWRKKFGDKVEELRKVADEEFTKTAHAINRRAEAIGAEPNYDEKWGPGRKLHTEEAEEAATHYRPTESKYKGGATVMYVTYDEELPTRGGHTALFPRVKRVYIPGEVKDWQVGDFPNRFGKIVHGVRIEYEKTRSGYQREAYTITRDGRTITVRAAEVKPTTQRFVKLVEVPPAARNIQFHTDGLPERYREALQDVR
jgi:hypothetical protein